MRGGGGNLLTTLVLSLLFAFLLLLLPSQAVDEVISPEDLFHRAVSKWQSSGKKKYESFHDLASQLQNLFSSVTYQNNRLDVVGAMEESILILERFIFEEQQGRENVDRDRLLSKLYTIYGTALSQLSPEECLSLARDPHTLLMGAEEAIRRHEEEKETKNKNSLPSSNKVCLENADNSARNAATLDATNREAEELLKTLDDIAGRSNGGVHERKPMEFVAELFDQFADTFDEKLLDNLQYKVPELVGKLTQELLLSVRNSNNNKKLFQNALDAGVGTGLAGPKIRNLVEHALIGVDASQKMLTKAKTCTRSVGCGRTPTKQQNSDDNDGRPLYDDLILMDLEQMTVDNTLRRVTTGGDGFDLIVAADVLVYFGSLQNLLSTFSNISTPGSILVFSCEKATETEAPLGWRLTTSGRFAHTKEHAISMAESVGYNLKHYQDIVPRIEKGEPVKGHLFGFQLSSPKEKGGEETGEAKAEL